MQSESPNPGDIKPTSATVEPTVRDEEKTVAGKEDGKIDAQVLEAEPEEPYSVYSINEKRFIVALASIAALFSPLSANIYYSALLTLSDDLHVSLTLINLTITSYLVSSNTTSFRKTFFKSFLKRPRIKHRKRNYQIPGRKRKI